MRKKLLKFMEFLLSGILFKCLKCDSVSRLQCFIKFILEQMSAPALNTCANILEEVCEPKRTVLLQALVYIHESKALRVKMKEPEGLEPLRKIDEIKSFSNKELRLSIESMGTLVRSSEHCRPVKKSCTTKCRE